VSLHPGHLATRDKPPPCRAASQRFSRWRRATQGSTLLLYLALPFAGMTWVTGTLVALKLGPVDLLEPAAALSAALAARTVGWWLLLGTAPVALLAAALGPVYCSWFCPFGFLSEALDRLRPRRWRRWSGQPWVGVRRVRISALAAFFALSLGLGLPLAALLAPPRLATALPLEAHAARGIPIVTASLLAAILAFELLGPRRLVCRALCPAGALANLLRAPFSLRPRFAEERCRCPDIAPCLQACPWGIDPREMRLHDGCTTCLACVDRCPSGALFTLRRPSRDPIREPISGPPPLAG